MEYNTNTAMLQEQLNRIEAYTLLGAKSMLCLTEVALLTGLSKSHLYKLTCSRQIPHYKPSGKQIYFDKTEIESWMRQNRVNTTDEAASQAAAYVMKKGGGEATQTLSGSFHFWIFPTPLIAKSSKS